MSDPPPPVAASVPRTESDRHALIFDKARGWEYALYGFALLDQLARYGVDFRDWEIGYVAEVGRRVADEDVLDLVSDFQSRSLKLVENFNVLMSEQAHQRAFGKPGEPGDALLIEHLGRRLVDVYASLIAAVADLRAARVESYALRLVNAVAAMDENPIRAARQFIEDYVSSVNQAFDALRKDSTTNTHFNLMLTLMIPPDVMAEVNEATEEFGRDVLRRHG